ncbi:MAG: M28 family peptidase [Bacteroidetes bacterium]|nr:MAG: M28 family peptidase [Bacteroidota bacterium]
MNKTTWLLSFLLVFSFTAIAQTLSEDPAIKKRQVFTSITEKELETYVEELTSTKFKGRLAGSPEYMLAAEYVADLLEQWGIEPLGDNGSYFQYFDWPYTEVLSTGALKLFSEGKTFEMSAPEDYYPGAASDNGTTRAEVIFAGYGISAPELGYDDYAGIDVQGKIVMIAGRMPYGGSNPDTLAMWGPYSSPVYKVRNAYENGAAGVLYMDKLASPGMPYFPGFRMVHIDTHVSEQILGTPADSILVNIRKRMSPRSFATGFEAEITAETVHHGPGRTANVIGYIAGNDKELTEEAIVLGAHLDGQGYLGFELPGALDNASGVADVLAAARALSHFNGQMKRSVVFIFFGGEEVGLVGSTLYCDNPPFSQEQTLLFMNLDMVGNGTGLALWHAESYPEILAHFQRNNDDYVQRSLRTTEGSMPVGRPRTDGVVFMQYGFRTLHVSTTDRVNPMYYHDPRDTADNLTYDIMRDVSRLLFLGVLDLSNDDGIRASDMFLIQ